MIMDSTNTGPKKRGKKWFLCIDDGSFKPKGLKGKTTEPVLTYIAVAEKDGAVLTPAILSPAFTAAIGCGEETESHRRKKGKDGSLRQALRAALNGTTLSKKINSRRKTRKDNLSRSSSNLEGEGGKISSLERKITHRTNSNSFYSLRRCNSHAIFTPSSLSSSSSSSSSRTHSTSGYSSELNLSLPTKTIVAAKQKQDDSRERTGNKGCYYCGSNIKALCMLLISLLVLTAWGKFLAILFTSIWLYIMPPGPGRRIRPRPCKEGVLVCGETTEFDSVQYKKKIIMEGLLQRSRLSRSHSFVSLPSMPGS